MENLIDFTVSDRIGYIILNRPEKRNALNAEMIKQLTNKFSEAEEREDVKMIVLKARGEVFSAGADLDYLRKLQQNSSEENLEDSANLKNLFKTIYNITKPVIAQIEGHAIAGGCGLVSVCDIVFAVPEAQFGYTEVKLGFIPALVSVFLIRKLGEGRTKELLLSGELISAETASAYGLINFIVKRFSIDDTVKEYALKLAKTTSADSVKRTKQLLQLIQNINLDEVLEEAVQANTEARKSDDFKRGVAAFLNKEKLTW
ncbi:MAG TPA: enoyl-CoA hydratase-related protein [Sphingobacteriaceae bacterium]|nr:enoyl-CoA hydratase-related protein [Sphingobacteriaceae bacterium]